MQTCRNDSHTTWRPNTYLHYPGCCRTWPWLIGSERVLARNIALGSQPRQITACQPPPPPGPTRILHCCITEELRQGRGACRSSMNIHCSSDTVNLPSREIFRQLRERTYFQFLLRGETDGKVAPPSQSPVHSEEPGKSHMRRCETDHGSWELLWEAQKRSGSWKTWFSSGFQTSLIELHCWSPSGVKWLILLNDAGSRRDPGLLFSFLKPARNRFCHYLLIFFFNLTPSSINIYPGNLKWPSDTVLTWGKLTLSHRFFKFYTLSALATGHICLLI